MPKTTQTGQSLAVAGLSLVAGLGLLALMIWKAELLVRMGLVGYLWYVLLLLVGLAAAVFLFSLFKSYARYSGNVLNGNLKFGGPGVLMLLIILLGFSLVPAPTAKFDFTVFLHGEAGRQSLILRGHPAFLLLDFGADRRREALGDKGEVRFVGIPADQLGRRVPVALEADGYELVESNAQVTLDTEAVYVAVRPKSLKLSGEVFDAAGRPLPGAQVALASHAAKTDANGRFSIALPSNLPDAERTLTITADGYQVWRNDITPGGNPLVVHLVAVQ